MSGTAGDALLASADADKPPKVSDPDSLEHLAGSVGFVEATEPDRLPRPLAPVDATPPEVFQIQATESNPLPRLLVSADANLPEVPDPDGFEQLAGTIVFHVETTTASDNLLAAAGLKNNLTICEGQDGAHSSLGNALMSPDMIRSRSWLGFSEDQQMNQISEVADVGYVRTSCGTVIRMDGVNCYTWKSGTGEPLMHLSLYDLIIPFPPLHSSIVQATTTMLLRTLVRYDEGTWYSQQWRDWPRLPDSVLHDILSDIDCTDDFHAFAYTCKSWRLASSLYPRPLLLHPLATPNWLFVNPGGRRNNAIGNFRLFPALRMEEHSTLIGGSTKLLIFLENSSCYIINIHTGQSRKLHVPYSGVERGVLSAPPESANSNILLVTGNSVLCKSVNGSDQWRVNFFGDIRVGAVDDIVFVGETAYLIDKNSSLFIITPDLEMSLWKLGCMEVRNPKEARRHGFGRRRGGFRRCGQSKIVLKNWLLEHRGELLRLSLMSYSDNMEVYSGFFLSRIGSNEMRKRINRRAERGGYRSLAENWPAESWIEMRTADLGDACVFVNIGNSGSFVSEKPGRWGLKGGQVFTCGPNVFPWVSYSLGWGSEAYALPKNIRWPCPVFMDSSFSFAPAEELDYQILFDKAPEPTALDLDSAASSRHTLKSEAEPGLGGIFPSHLSK